MINDSQKNSEDTGELGLTQPRKSECKQKAATTVTCDENFETTTKKLHAQATKE